MEEYGFYSSLRVGSTQDSSAGDPQDQLEVAFRTIRGAFRKKVGDLEGEISARKAEAAEKDNEIAALNRRIAKLESAVQEERDKVRVISEDLTRATNENQELNMTNRKLRKDLSKLQAFKKSILETLTEEDASNAERISERENAFASTSSASVLQTQSLMEQYQLGLSTSGTLQGYGRSTMNVDGSSNPTALRGDGTLLPNSVLTGAESMKTTSPAPVARGMTFNPTPAREAQSTNGAGMNRDYLGESQVSWSLAQEKGKQYFQQVRKQLSHEKFTQFLTIVKKLNSQQQTREQTLTEVAELFGPENHDLYASFKALMTHHG